MSIPSNPLNPRCNAIASHTFYPVVQKWVVFWIASCILYEASVMKSSSACASHSPQLKFFTKSVLKNWTYFFVFIQWASILPFQIQNAKNYSSTLRAFHILFVPFIGIVHCPQTIVMIVTHASALSICISISSICIRAYCLKAKSACVIICIQFVIINIDDCTIGLLHSGVDICIVIG